MKKMTQDHSRDLCSHYLSPDLKRAFESDSNQLVFKAVGGEWAVISSSSSLSANFCCQAICSQDKV